MMKNFQEHSARWQREQLRSGVKPARWNHWHRLAPSTRRMVPLGDYSRGISAPQLMREARNDQLVARWVDKLAEVGTTRPPRKGLIRAQVENMTERQKRTLKERLANDTPRQFRDRAKTRINADGEPVTNRYRY